MIKTSLPQLALILLQITQWAKIPTTGINTIRSIVFILKAFKIDALSQNISNKVKAALIPQIDKLRRDWEKVCLDIAPHPSLPDDTRIWAALQQASGGTWGGCVYDPERILATLANGSLATE